MLVYIPTAFILSDGQNITHISKYGKDVQKHRRAEVAIEEKEALERRPFLLPDVGDLAVEGEDCRR